MITYIITGTSSGIGEALAQLFLEKGERVIGLARRSVSFDEYSNYTHIQLDLADTKAVDAIDWSSFQITGELILINNAGILGDVGRSENLSANHYAQMAAINIVAPQVLSSNILSVFKDQASTILNISSGAGRGVIASWSGYCASKAALDHFSEVLQVELEEMNRTTRVYSLAPGVIDTAMQTQIRDANPEDFSSSTKFQDLKNNNGLSKASDIATQIDEFLSKRVKVVKTDLRDS